VSKNWDGTMRPIKMDISLGLVSTGKDVD